ncbi:MAG: hypothetical protein RR255_00190 [Bacilli bacterium]
MTNCDKEFLTIDKTGVLDENENGELILYIELKDVRKEYNVVELLKRMLGSTVQIKSVNEG